MRRTSQAFALGSMLGSLVLGSSALAQDGPEVDLTGTWEGAQICDDLIEGEFVHSNGGPLRCRLDLLHR
jgi:hypothetical protein